MPSWIPIYSEIAEKLLEYKNNRKPLIEILNDLNNKGYATINLKDEESPKVEIPLEDIDPFTFIANFNRGGNENRIKILSHLKDLWNITTNLPSDFDGIPVVNPMNSWFFSFKYERRENDIENLWQIFEQGIKGANYISGELFNNCLRQRGIAYNLTIGLYWINPDEFMPLDGKSREYLSKRLLLQKSDFDLRKIKWAGYISILKKIKQVLNKSYFEISREAWLENHSKKTKEVKDKNGKDYKPEKKNINEPTIYSLNTILYGPPGTGKTYATREMALQILGIDTKTLTREEISKLFKKYSEEGRIEFITFHQSFSYEDFMEGIKPVVSESEDEENSTINYEIEDGIFKKLCIRAKKRISTGKSVQYNPNQVKYYKMSLGGKNNPFIHNWCIQNSYAAGGWGRNNDFSDFIGISEWNTFRDKFKKAFPKLYEEKRFAAQAMFAFINMRKGDIVIATKGNNKIDAIGIVDGEYEYREDTQIDYCHLRKVNWILKDLKGAVDEFVTNNISQRSIYEFDSKDIRKEYIKELISSDNNGTGNYVLIIDEINRGNVAAIFGELITLIEADKRANRTEELATKLPYSKTLFSVPDNIYIIGTMNTADRSVEALDTALRRRFTFVEKAPEPDLLSQDSYKCEGIDLSKMLEAINYRLEKLLDKDHRIGHAYFMNIRDKANPLPELKVIFKQKIIPLLQEYFYGNPERIGLVLGDAFVKRIDDSKISFKSGFDNEESYLEEKSLYEIVIPDDLIAFTDIYAQK
ncbi:MAG: AAA family ATPase [Ignavibacterium sp.]|jgi:5-methylcytosine-specific restriction protein B|uniref:AAA family ATPase n=1 Tax=Ignavibacterium sp. TaxID=2651167 RepID=UPI00329A1921